jgi:hypothetical protein
VSYTENRIKLAPDSWVHIRRTVQEGTADDGAGNPISLAGPIEWTIEVTLLDGRTLTASAPHMTVRFSNT